MGSFWNCILVKKRIQSRGYTRSRMNNDRTYFQIQETMALTNTSVVNVNRAMVCKMGIRSMKNTSHLTYLEFHFLEYRRCSADCCTLLSCSKYHFAWDRAFTLQIWILRVTLLDRVIGVMIISFYAKWLWQNSVWGRVITFLHTSIRVIPNVHSSMFSVLYPGRNTY